MVRNSVLDGFRHRKYVVIKADIAVMIYDLVLIRWSAGRNANSSVSSA